MSYGFAREQQRWLLGKKPSVFVSEMNLSTLSFSLERLAESMHDAMLSPDALSKIPKHSLLLYSLFLSDLGGVRSVVLHWIEVLKEDATPFKISADKLQQQWRLVEQLLSSARTLQASLAITAGVTKAEARTIYQRQYDRFISHWKMTVSDNAKIVTLQAAMNKNVPESKINRTNY